MHKPVIALSLALILSVLTLADLLRPPEQSFAYGRGVESGFIIGHNHMINQTPCWSGDACVDAASADMPWSVRLALPRRIGDYRAGWLAGYKRGINYHRP